MMKLQKNIDGFIGACFDIKNSLEEKAVTPSTFLKRFSAYLSIRAYDDGFVYTGNDGATVSYRFIPGEVSSEENVETNSGESVTENNDFAAKTIESEITVPYTDKEKQNWENSNTIIVYESDEQFEAFVEKVLKNEDTHKKIYFGKIPDATARVVFDKTGVDVSGHNIALKGYEIRKILINSHGDKEAEMSRGQEPITTDDLKKIPQVITNPDDVKLSDKKYEGKARYS